MDCRKSDIKNLVSLLNLGDTDSEDDGCEAKTNMYKRNPHSVAYDIHHLKNYENEGEKSKKNDISKQSKNIWSDDEVLDDDYDEAQTKERPEYEMVYQQDVTADDVFLQLSGKGPGSNSCECLLIKIKLPETISRNDITLKISALSLICKTRKYYLDLDFPRHVDPSKCSAKWNQSNYVLIIRLYFEDECLLG
ncbi:hypothetical protein X975_07859, partial [Stegodyphus mimosarum]